MQERAVAELMSLQSGVISRRQVLAAGGRDADIARLLRRRIWAHVHDGVYADHTGPLTWSQRAWAAVLYHWPAALSGESALAAHGLLSHASQTDRPIRVQIDRRRSVRACPGVSATRIAGYGERTLGHLSPPRDRVEHAVLTVASQATSEDGSVAVVANACQQRRTTCDRLLVALGERPRLQRRRLLLTILQDVASGTYSALERRYLTHVERPHGLPTAARQRQVLLGARPTYRDVEYLALGTTVELDGRLGHEEPADRWADLDRDLDTALTGGVTVRIGWGQVLQPCRLASAVGRLLVVRGWTGRVHPCGMCADVRAPGA